MPCTRYDINGDSMVRFWGRGRQTSKPKAPEVEQRQLLERLRERMSLTHGMWRLMTAGEAVRPRELAIVFGMMDSIGQSLGADQDITQKAVELVLESSEFSLCMAAGSDPTLQSWVMAGGQAVHEIATGDKGSPTDILSALARQYLADVRARPDV
jgi:hypothetical protein